MTICKSGIGKNVVKSMDSQLRRRKEAPKNRPKKK
jgi:hypothetical protein